jgi:stalled ribosome rescue protein Dom34
MKSINFPFSPDIFTPFCEFLPEYSAQPRLQTTEPGERVAGKSIQRKNKSMALLAIWVDSKHAKLFRFTSKAQVHKNFEAHAPSHHTHEEDQIEKLKHENHFFKDLMPELVGADEVLIVGPGMAKDHLLTFIKEHHREAAARVKGCETVDHPTDAQIIALARKFFSEEHLIHI